MLSTVSQPFLEFTAIYDSEHQDDLFLLKNVKHDAVVADSEAVEFVSGSLDRFGLFPSSARQLHLFG